MSLQDAFIKQEVLGYKIDKLIGQGGMGKVYHAINDFGEEVAIKVITNTSSEGVLLERFKREGKYQAKIEHPNIVRIISNETIGENPVIIMEYIEGKTLKELIREKGKLHFTKAIRLMIPICKGLKKIHDKGIIHRDIKSSNIILSDEGPKICDFGVARSIEDTQLTLTGQLPLGTPSYMALERFEKTSPDIDKRSDIYSLGIVLYEMVIGEVPFKGQICEIIRQLIGKEVTIKEENKKQLIKEVESLILKLSAKDPQDRYQSIDEILPELKILKLVFDAVNFTYDIAICNINKALEIDPQRPIIYVQAGFIYNEMKEYDKAIENSSKAIELDPENIFAYYNRGLSYDNKNNFDKAIEDYTRAIELDPELAFAYNNRGKSYKNKGIYNKAIEDYNKAIEFAPEDAIAYSNRANCYKSLDMYDKAFKDYNKAIELNPKFYSAYCSRGNGYSSKGMHDQAIEDYNKAIELNPKYAHAYNNRGRSYEQKRMYDQAIENYNKTIELNPKDAIAYNNRGNCYNSKGMWDYAIEDYNKAIELNPGYVKAYNNRGNSYNRKGESNRAMEDFHKAIELEKGQD